LVLFGLIYGYLALSRWEVLLRSYFLIGLGLLWLVGFILLAHIFTEELNRARTDY
jgi:multisubunit Na+/H+ antiporter MnhB subunit